MVLLPNNAKIAEYKILGHLGSGGFANTYRAYDSNLDKDVAIKEFFPRRYCSRDENYRVLPLPGEEERFRSLRDSFLREARILAQFDEKNIVKVLRYFEGLETAYMIMEYVDGRNLGSVIQENAVQPEDRVVGWLRGLLRGLGTVHAGKVIHGDIKPRNIIITESDEAVLIDFGAAVAHDADADDGGAETTETAGEVFASLNYAAPEQLHGGRIDQRTDLYSLGSVFYELVTHERLGRERTEEIAEDQILAYGRFYGARFLRTVHRAIQLDPEARFSDSEDWLEELTLSRWEKTGRFLRRRRKSLIAAAAVLAAATYAVNYVVENEIDRENAYFKILASKAEIDAQMELGHGYRTKLEKARDYLAAYATEYRSQVDKLAPANLITGRSSVEGLQQAVRVTESLATRLSAVAARIDTMQAKYYFGRYPGAVEEADRLVTDIDARIARLTRDLLAAIVENGIVGEGRRRRIHVDNVGLAELVTGVKESTEPVTLPEMVPRSRPLVDSFLTRQLERMRVARLARERATALSRLETLRDAYPKGRRAAVFPKLIEQARQADVVKDLKALVARGERTARTIDRELQLAEVRRKKLRAEAKLRGAIQKIEAGMRPVPPGRFMMGGPDQGYAQPVREVSVSRFFLGVNEVSVGEWMVCVREKKCAAAGGARMDRPVTGITWNQVQEFIRWLNGRSRRYRFRLPSEAEWEYVIKRYGYREKELTGGLMSITANNTNKLGLNAMLGNALEWLDDCWHGGYYRAPVDGSSWNRGLQCNKRVVRGSSWDGKHLLEATNAAYFRPPQGVERTKSLPTLGFRLAGDRK